MNHNDKQNSSSSINAPAGGSYELHRDPRNPDTIGLVIGNLDPTLREALGMPEETTSVGIVSSKKSSLKNIFGADEAIK
jgi:hypothetical protein